MKNINAPKNSLFIIFIFLFSCGLFGCSHHANPKMKYLGNHNIQGTIQAQANNIPADAVITLSISPLEHNDPVNGKTYDFQIVTKQPTRSLPFAMGLPSELNSQQPLGVSVRVEKDDELLMMSSKIAPMSLTNQTQHLSLVVVTL